MQLRQRHGEDDTHNTVYAESALASRIKSNLKSFDIYPKMEETVEEQGLVKTTFGGITTLITAFILFCLFFSELSEYMSTTMVHHLKVDTEGMKRLQIYYNFTFPSLPCSELHLDLVRNLACTLCRK